MRYPEATIPALFIPLFFLAVNIGQVSETFPDTTPFLGGQGYVAFQLPVSLMFAVATASSGLALVTEIENGLFRQAACRADPALVDHPRAPRRGPGARPVGVDRGAGGRS